MLSIWPEDGEWPEATYDDPEKEEEAELEPVEFFLQITH